ncbi:MAG: LAGLIDADG family homing endonuclease [Methanosarcinales archaeon]
MYIAGLIASDGAITKRGKYQYTITFVNTNKKLISAYEIYKKIFPEKNLSIDLKDSVDSLIDGRSINYTTDCYACSTSNPIFGLLLENLGIKVGKNGDWNLHRLLSLSDELIASFIRGYFDGDGSVRLRVNKNWNEKWKSGEIYLAISDEKSAGHLQLLLKRLGIVSHVRKDNTVYRVEMHGNKNLIRFANIVGSRHPEKAMKLREIKEYYKKTAQDSKNVTSEILPYFAGKLVSEVPNVHNILSESTLYYYKTGKSRPYARNIEKVIKYYGSEEGDVKSISKQSERPASVASVDLSEGKVGGTLTHPISKLKTILDSDYFLDEIKTIESIKPKDKYVYNLTVADTHCYFANQILIKNCGCFEVVGFYMPELDGIGWVDRDYSGIAPNGLPFSTMAGQTGGGKQIIGFLGVGVNYFRSPKFIQADGGWNRVVWMTKHLKNRVLEDIPKEIVDAIATEEEAKDLDSLKNFLIEKKHPILDKWKKEEEELKEEAEKEVTPMKAEASASAQSAQPFIPMPSSQLQLPQIPQISQSGGSSSIKLILKNAKISIERIVIKRK